MLSPNDSEIVATIQQIARQELHLAPELLEGDLLDHLDSIQKMSLAVAIEDHFQIILTGENEGISNLAELVAAVKGSQHVIS